MGAVSGSKHRQISGICLTLMMKIDVGERVTQLDNASASAMFAGVVGGARRGSRRH